MYCDRKQKFQRRPDCTEGVSEAAARFQQQSQSAAVPALAPALVAAVAAVAAAVQAGLESNSAAVTCCN